jgi:DNA end-binding protein Ku
MRSIWTGAIGFGLVNIPVKMFSATESSSLDLDMLDKKDHSHIRYVRVNENTGEEVEWGNIVKGYKLDDEYVVLDNKDFENAAPKKTKVIEIVEFTDADQIDSIYFEAPYYLEPDKSGERAYALLREALKKTGKVGVATYVMRNREHLAVIKPLDDVLVVNRIRFEEEIRDHKDLNLPKKELKGKELEMATQLIDSLSGNFDISAYKDTYSHDLLKVIEAKAHGKKPKYSKLEVVPTKAHDLMSQLKASLSKSAKSQKKKAS